MGSRSNTDNFCAITYKLCRAQMSCARAPGGAPLGTSHVLSQPLGVRHTRGQPPVWQRRFEKQVCPTHLFCLAGLGP